MAENVQISGRLGLESRDQGTLSAAVSAVVDTLEDFGHPAEAIEARAENAVRLQCDQYLVTVRLRRVPLRRSSRLTGSMLQPSALLELALSPLYPEDCDREISETLLAEMLRRLVPMVEATSVEWLDTDVALTCDQFLSVFEPQPAQTPPAAAIAAGSQPMQPQPPRPRGRACFTPVELTAPVLEAHCERAFQAAGRRAPGPGATTAAERTRARMRGPLQTGPQYSGWGGQARASALSAFILAPRRRLRFVSHLLLMAALFLFLDSAGMVQAARPLFH
ncbi:hypothetical protein K3720_07735 [Leisingera caerulea]|uniref:hypothetical protein n=1 Tax=Leisingera caerulea TaxID=506591 RepID=UPI0021A29EDE|nr:hypothetical protein [Leisingera caerulea]UWQ51299.1 hypothetical protein K3720_07735 [Leisingera caerulea]